MRRGGWRWLGVPKPLCAQLGAPNVGSRAPKNQPPRQRKSKGRRERGGGVRAPPKTSHTPPKELGAMWRPPFGADEPNDQAGNATTRRAAPNQIRAEQTPRAERPRPEHHDKQEPAPHNEQTKRPRRGGRHMAPTNTNQHTDPQERARTPPPRPGAPTPLNQQTEQKKARGNPLSGPPAGRNVVSEPPAIASLLARMLLEPFEPPRTAPTPFSTPPDAVGHNETAEPPRRRLTPPDAVGHNETLQQLTAARRRWP